VAAMAVQSCAAMAMLLLLLPLRLLEATGCAAVVVEVLLEATAALPLEIDASGGPGSRLTAVAAGRSARAHDGGPHLRSSALSSSLAVRPKSTSSCRSGVLANSSGTGRRRRAESCSRAQSRGESAEPGCTVSALPGSSASASRPGETLRSSACRVIAEPKCSRSVSFAGRVPGAPRSEPSACVQK
jgi:hypothetical protein